MKLVIAIPLSLFPVLAIAATLVVPQNFTSIQFAIDAAQDGDTVLVSEGVYYENLRIINKDIVLTSRFGQESNPEVILNTVIDGSQYSDANQASAVYVQGGGPACTVEGFTIRGGGGSLYMVAGWGNYLEGGGIYITASSARIRNNVIAENRVRRQGATFINAGGAAMHTSGGAPVVEGNIIACNYGGYGSALITNHSNLSFRNNIVFNNIAEPFEVGAAYGATVLIFGGTAEIEYNTIAGNISRGNSLPGSGRGAGILMWNSSGSIRSNIIWHNEQSLGGQVFLNNSPGVLLSQNNIEGNTWPGNIDGDPLLMPGSLALAPGSPSLHPDGRQQGAYGGDGPGLLPVLAQAGAYLFRRQYEASVNEDGQALLSLDVLNTGTAPLEFTSAESIGGSLAIFAGAPTIPFLDAGTLTLVIEPVGESDTLLMFHNACHSENPLPIVVDYQYTSQAGEASQPAFSIFPNPANNQLSVEMPAPGKYELHLLDAAGQRILKKETGETADSAQLEIGNLPKGPYVLLVFENGILRAAEQLVK